MRTKEEAADYRYFSDPDLPLIKLNDQMIENIKATMPELPHAKLDRLVQQGLSSYEAEILINDRELSRYYDQARALTESKLLINWILRDLISHLNENKIGALESKVTPEKLVALITLLETGKINNHAAKEVFEVVAATGASPADVVKEKGLEQIGSSEELEKIISAIVAAHPDEVAQYKSGKDRVFGFFVGMAMKQTKGKGNPKIIQELLKKHLA
jgi:aspartyl-tRNA(Asn)/glutamyl-tRNA(Gln) amidotransferase subunit B